MLRGLESAKEFARTYRFEMTDEYRALIARVEPCRAIKSGADKSSASLGSYAQMKALFNV